MKRNLFGKLEVEVDDGACEEGLWPEKSRHPETLRFLYRKLRKMDSPVMLDIGAGQGRYALLAKFVPNMHVFCWEPNPILLDYLESNVRLNGLGDRITVFRCGLWNSRGLKTLYAHPRVRRSRSATMGEHPHKNKWHRVKVEVNKLDDFMSYWRKVDLVKLDVEGAEWFVLRGGRKTIKRRLPPIFMEWMENTTDMFDYTLKQMEDHLRTWGYKNFEPHPPYDMWVTP